MISLHKDEVQQRMLKHNPNGDFPIIHESAFIDDTAYICGKVVIEANVFVGPYAVIRADELDDDGNIETVTIKRDSNIQDGVVIHSRQGAKAVVGERVSIAHRCVVHGPCLVGDRVFIGFNSVVFNCRIGNDCMVSHNSVVDGCEVPEKKYVPPLTSVLNDSDLSKLKPLASHVREFSESVIAANHYLVKGYKALGSKQ